jgi:dihydroxyacetone kinase
VPGRAPPDPNSKERIENGAVEIGMGIHNESGSDRATVALPELVKMMLRNLLDQKDENRAYLNVNSNEVVLLINNLGGVSVLELGGITAEVVKQLADDWNIKPVRILSGTFMTSLNGLGFSISILNVVNTDIGGPSMLQLLDSPAEAVGWTAPITKETWEKKSTATRKDVAEQVQKVTASGLTMDPVIFQSALNAGLDRVIAAESFVTKCDTIVGDGDCGIGLKRGAEAILNMESKCKLTGDIVVDVSRITEVVETSMDGTSGALYAIFLNSLVKALRAQPKGEATPKTWSDALIIALQALSKYTPARPGDRTLADALYPFVETLAGTGDLKLAADAAKRGAEKTKGMEASLGRSVYVGGSGFKEVPDPGAWGLCQFFLGLAGVDLELGDAKAGESDYEMI